MLGNLVEPGCQFECHQGSVRRNLLVREPDPGNDELDIRTGREHPAHMFIESPPPARSYKSTLFSNSPMFHLTRK